MVRKLVFIDGKAEWLTADELVHRGLAAPAFSGVGITSGYSEGKPGKSMGMSCHPSQCAERNAMLRAHGITGVHYDPSKRDNCVITSRKGRRDAMRVFGYHDRDAGYSD